MENKHLCSECERKYAIFNKDPDCDNCPRSFKGQELDDYFILDIWILVFNNVIMGFDGAVDINISAVIDVINLYDIKDNEYKLKLLKGIVETWRYFNSKMRNENKVNISLPGKKNIKKRNTFKG